MSKYILLFLLSFSAHADTIIITVCGDPVMFIHRHEGENIPISPSKVAPFKDSILKDIAENKAIFIEAERYSKQAVCGIPI